MEPNTHNPRRKPNPLTTTSRFRPEEKKESFCLPRGSKRLWQVIPRQNAGRIDTREQIFIPGVALERISENGNAMRKSGKSEALWYVKARSRDRTFNVVSDYHQSLFFAQFVTQIRPQNRQISCQASPPSCPDSRHQFACPIANQQLDRFVTAATRNNNDLAPTPK